MIQGVRSVDDDQLLSCGVTHIAFVILLTLKSSWTPDRSY
jgi:hypothetical protein